jgi:hypothetical protein
VRELITQSFICMAPYQDGVTTVRGGDKCSLVLCVQRMSTVCVDVVSCGMHANTMNVLGTETSAGELGGRALPYSGGQFCIS